MSTAAPSLGTGAITLRVGSDAGSERLLPGPAAACAVLVVDVQRSFAAPEELAANGVDAAGRARVAAAIAATARLVDAARSAGAKVVWVQLEQRAEAPWRASFYLRGRAPGTAGPCMAGTPGAEWYGIAPGPGEPVVSKRRYSGFIGTDLHAVLQSLGVDWVVPCGLTTECCVESTARDAFQLDYPVVMAEEASASYRGEEHDRSLELLAVNFALITGIEDLLTALAAGSALETPAAAAS